MDKSKFEKAIFSDYAFVGWVWTITFHEQEIGAGQCPSEFVWLGDTGDRGWSFPHAMRKGWQMLGDDARAFAVENLLPLCQPWLRDYLLGVIVERTPRPPLGSCG